jgi:hypothetical protein
MTKLYEERSRERGEEVDARQLQSFVQRHNLDTIRAHCCWSFCYAHDYDFIDETGATSRQSNVEDDDDDMPEKDFCTRLWGFLSAIFWCCGCWCQCFGMCALAQEEREVNRLTENDEQKFDYITFQPYSEYYLPSRICGTTKSKALGNTFKLHRSCPGNSSKMPLLRWLSCS